MNMFKWIGLIVGCVSGGYIYARYEEKRHKERGTEYSGTIFVTPRDDGNHELYLELDGSTDNLMTKKDVSFRIINTTSQN